MPLLAVRGNGPAGAYGFGAASGKAAAMTAIASNTLGADAATVTFSSIPGTYDDLMVVIYARADTAGQNLLARFNSDAASNYSGTFLEGDAATYVSNMRSSFSSLNVEFNAGIPDAASTFSGLTLNVMNYANTTSNKTALVRHAADRNFSGAVELGVGLWRSTSAITSIEFRMSSGNLRTGSVFALYGIKKAV